jgi:catalase-peroxidase
MGLGWKNSFGSGFGDDTISSGIEGAWNSTPTKWDMGYFDTLFNNDWNLVKSPAGAWQWVPADPKAHNVPMAGDSSKTQAPIMTTADLALRMHPIYKPIAKHFHENPDEFADAFARAWFKLTHRDMGPISRYLGVEVPSEEMIWQDPIPSRDYDLIDETDIEYLKDKILNSGLSVSELVSTAWASASTFRASDFRGGANGARIRLEPQVNWEVNQPRELKKVLDVICGIQNDFNNSQNTDKKVSVADLIVLGGNVAIEKAIKNAGYDLNVPFKAGRTDATEEQTDIRSFDVIEPKADGFRNYLKAKFSVAPEELLIDKAQLLKLTAPEMTVLLGGMRVLNTNYGHAPFGVFTNKADTLSNDFFVNVLDMNTKWKPTGTNEDIYEGIDRKTGERKWMATRVDLIFGSNSRLRALSEVYACDDATLKFLNDFIYAWNKVMDADRFDLM